MPSGPPRVRQPAEWEPHAAVWTAWPSHAEYWEGHIEAARVDVARMLKALCEPCDNGASPEQVHLWVDPSASGSARSALAGMDIVITEQPLGDIWFRDIGPIFVRGTDGSLQYRTFGYNGWGGKYLMEHDDAVGQRIAHETGLTGQFVPAILEGGALDVDGTGLGMTTRSCLLNPNRNPNLSQPNMERLLEEHLGVDSLIWLEDGLLNDHTDGHVDNIARFIGPGKVVCQHPSGADDPNEAVLGQIAADLRAYRTPSGRALEVIEIPSPGKVTGPDGSILPASHMNFYIANHRVLVPVYGTDFEDKALEQLQDLFPDREVVGLPAPGLLMGGGAFHCITQQQPL
ncbi:MAG: agmatine deiminase family protein [Puniceicoccaceae bacterium]